MRVVFSGILSDASLQLASRVAEELGHLSGAPSVSGWFFSETPVDSRAGVVSNFRWNCIETGLFNDASYSIKELRLYRELMDSPNFPTIRSVCLKLLNRRDFTGTFRLLEREVIFQQSVLSALAFLSFERPSLLVFPVSPHQFMPVVAMHVAAFLRIPVLHMQPCPLAPVVFPKIMVGDGALENRPLSARFNLPYELSDIAERQLRELTNFNDPVYMKRQKDRDMRAKAVGQRAQSFLFALRWIREPRFPNSIDFSGQSGTPSLIYRIASVVLTRNLETSLKRRAAKISKLLDSQQDFCVFALHYEPERTSLPEGLPIEFQGDAVAIARSIVPKEMKLFVKEHYSQTSSALRGFLGRSPLFYDLVGSLENTSLVPTGSRLSELLSGSKCVFTLTGTVALESVLKGVPVAYFGSPWWAGLPGTIRITSETRFSDISSVGLPTKPQIIKFLLALVADTAIIGAGGESRLALEERFGELPVDFESLEAKQISGLLLGFLGLEMNERNQGDPPGS